MFPFLGIKKAEKEVHGLFVGKDTQFVGILDIHNFITNVVGSLNQINQRMAGMTHGTVCALIEHLQSIHAAMCRCAGDRFTGRSSGLREHAGIIPEILDRRQAA